MIWNVFREDWNGKSIVTYNVLNDYFIPMLKKFKKESKDINEFSEKMKLEMRYHFWCRCEWELTISKEDNKIMLSSLFGKTLSIEVTNENSIDWNEFYECIGKRRYDGKFDVYDQLEFNWGKFINYCWYTHLPYERKEKKFEKVS